MARTHTVYANPEREREREREKELAPALHTSVNDAIRYIFPNRASCVRILTNVVIPLVHYVKTYIHICVCRSPDVNQPTIYILVRTDTCVFVRTVG